MRIHRLLLFALLPLGMVGCTALPPGASPATERSAYERSNFFRDRSPRAAQTVRSENRQTASDRLAPIPSSNRSIDEAIALAMQTKGADATLRIAEVAATGSLRPYLGESALVIIEPTTIDSLRPGQLVTFRSRGAEFIHIYVGRTSAGIVTRGAREDTEEIVPFDQVTGTQLAMILFDPSSKRGPTRLPLLLASSESNLPARAGSLRIVGASVPFGAAATPIHVLGSGEYSVDLPPGGALSISVGVQGDARVRPAEVSISWSPAVAGKTVRYQVYHPEAGDAGIVVLDASFALAE